MRKLLSWLVPRRLSIDVNLRAKEGGKEKTEETLSPLLSRPFPWLLALLHQSLTFRASLCSRQKCGKRSAPSGYLEFQLGFDKKKKKIRTRNASHDITPSVPTCSD